jgi:hypothetical protein
MRVVVGKSEPGYASANGTPHRYFLTEEFATKKLAEALS